MASGARTRTGLVPSACTVMRLLSMSSYNTLLPSGAQSGYTPYESSSTDSCPVSGSTVISWSGSQRLNTMRDPSGDQSGMKSRIWSVSVRLTTLLPSESITQMSSCGKSPMPVLGRFGRVNAMRVPSGDHEGSVLFELNVNCVGVPPVASTTKISE